MKKILIYFYLLTSNVFSFAQGKNISASDLNLLIPRNSYIYAELESDINNDGYMDKFLILANKNEDSAKEGDDAYYRVLWVMLGSKNGFTKIVDSKTLVYCKLCGGVIGDPFLTIEFKPPYFTIEHYGGSGWRWQSFITFKYFSKEKKIYLHKTGNVVFHISKPDDPKITIKSKKDFGWVNIIDFDIYNR